MAESLACARHCTNHKTTKVLAFLELMTGRKDKTTLNSINYFITVALNATKY